MQNIKIIKNAAIQNPDSPEIKADIVISENKIIEIVEDVSAYQDAEIIDASGCIITPGLIDQHLHGGYGVDFNTATAEEIINLAKKLPQHGITSFVPTIMTDTSENILRQIREISSAIENQPVGAANIIGIHLEGPFINPEYKGIHPESLMLVPTIENFQKFESKYMKIVSYAPELDKNLEFTHYLKNKNIIPSAGHSKANPDEMKMAVENGLKQVTHLFNAMPPLHHRAPGILGASLVNDEIYTEVIADNEHLHPLIIDLILKIKPKNKVIFISDSLPLSHSEEDFMIFGGHKIYRKNNRAVNNQGTFAGSLSYLDDNLRKNKDKISLSDFLIYASLNPAQNLSLSKKGRIEKNYDADLIFWDENFTVKKAIIGGVNNFS